MSENYLYDGLDYFFVASFRELNEDIFQKNLIEEICAKLNIYKFTN